jgi:hypothetical protein
MDVLDVVEALKAKAEELAVDELDWFESENNSRVVGIDWCGGVLFVIDPESPAFPCIEQAVSFDGDTNVVYEGEGN